MKNFNDQYKQSLYESVTQYLDAGFSIIPVKKDKKPLLNEWKTFQQRKPTVDEVNEWFDSPNLSGIGIVTGKISNLVVVDTEKDAALKNIELGKTLVAHSGGGGKHFYYKHPGHKVSNKARIKELIDIRGDGGYIIAPPSKHLSGKNYTWETNFDIELLKPLPKWVTEDANCPTSKTPITLKIKKGRRNDQAARQIGIFLKNKPQIQWEEFVWPMFEKWNQDNCDPPLKLNELRSIYDSISERELENETTKKGETKASLLYMAFQEKDVEAFHDQYKEAFVYIKDEGRAEIIKCDSKRFKNWLIKLNWEKHGKVISGQALNEVCSLIESKAIFDGKQYDLDTRVARKGDEIWYDLASNDGVAIKITKEGCESIKVPPVLFKRYQHQSVQIVGDDPMELDEIFKLIRITDEHHRLLFKVMLVASLIPDIPRPMPVFFGPQGSAKSTACKILKQLIDPSALSLLSMPKDANELIQQLAHHYVLVYDNIQYINDTVSDVLCRAITGEGSSKRKLFSDDDDVIYSYKRFIGVNGINVVAHKPDLLDRAILFNLDRITEAERKTETALWLHFKRIQPNIFKSMLQTLSKAMVAIENVNLKNLPRMADFAVWGYAIAEALNIGGDEFIQAYTLNRIQQNQEVIENTPIAAVIVKFIEENENKIWEGEPSELFDELTRIANLISMNTNSRSWPKAPNVLMRKLNEIKPNLKEVGIEYEQERGDRRKIKIIRNKKNSDLIVEPSKENDDIDASDDILVARNELPF